ncbi:MAG: ParA-like protein, partial [uncultured Craurococcus sp.]
GLRGGSGAAEGRRREIDRCGQPGGGAGGRGPPRRPAGHRPAAIPAPLAPGAAEAGGPRPAAQLRQPLRLARARRAGPAAAGPGLRHRRHPAPCRDRGEAGDPRRRPRPDADAALARRFLGQRGDGEVGGRGASPRHRRAQPRACPGAPEGKHPGGAGRARGAGAGGRPRQPGGVRHCLPRRARGDRVRAEEPGRGRAAGAGRGHRRHFQGM